MPSLLARVLLFASALSLACPAGWCCVLPASAAPSAQAQPPCCRHCKPQGKKSAPKPIRPLRSACCCTPAPVVVSKIRIGTHGVAAHSITVPHSVRIPIDNVTATPTAPLLSPSLQVMHCTWQC